MALVVGPVAATSSLLFLELDSDWSVELRGDKERESEAVLLAMCSGVTCGRVFTFRDFAGIGSSSSK